MQPAPQFPVYAFAQVLSRRVRPRRIRPARNRRLVILHRQLPLAIQILALPGRQQRADLQFRPNPCVQAACSYACAASA